MANTQIPGNKVQLLNNASRFYDAMLEDIRAAESYILMEYYIFREDTISTTILEALAERARAGVRVCVILDYFGCLQHFEEFGLLRPIKTRYFKKYTDLGVELVFYHRALRLPRNHRKLTLIDGRIAYTGGMNVSDQYIYGIPRIGKLLDIHLRIEGPVVDAFHAGFVRMWEACGKQPLGISFPAPPVPCGEATLSVFESPLPGKASDPEVFYCKLFEQAQESLRIISPYFWPTKPIRRGLKEASGRGVRVEMLTGADSDLPVSPISWFLLQNARTLARKGYFTLHIEPHCFHHAKVVSIDGRLCMVGSYNMDYFSLRVNHELGVLIDDPALAREFDRYFDERAKHSIR